MKKQFIIIISILFLLNGCQLLPEDAQFHIYRVPVQQGNVISEEKASTLKIGMTEEQVKFLLGAPVTENIFNNNRWDYVYYKKNYPDETQLTILTIFFDKNKITSMKRISHKDTKLFDITGKENNPKFTDEEIVNTVDTIDVEIIGNNNNGDKVIEDTKDLNNINDTEGKSD